MIIRFPDRDALDRWYRSEEYQELAIDRWEAGDSVVTVIRGVS